MVAADFWMRSQDRLDPGDRLVAATGPGSDVPEGVVAACRSRALGRRRMPWTRLPARQAPGCRSSRGAVREPSRERASSPAGRGCSAISTRMRCSLWQQSPFVLPSNSWSSTVKPMRLCHREELSVVPSGVFAIQPVADGWQLFAVSLSDVEHRHELEATDDPVVLAVFGVGGSCRPWGRESRWPSLPCGRSD